jgi:predicted transcriptional regulator
MAVADRSPKQQMIEAIEDLPEDSTHDQILRELAFARMVERGVADAKAGNSISHEEMGRRISSWAR